jgi:hypothetical protein
MFASMLQALSRDSALLAASRTLASGDRELGLVLQGRGASSHPVSCWLGRHPCAAAWQLAWLRCCSRGLCAGPACNWGPKGVVPHAHHAPHKVGDGFVVQGRLHGRLEAWALDARSHRVQPCGRHGGVRCWQPSWRSRAPAGGHTSRTHAGWASSQGEAQCCRGWRCNAPLSRRAISA